jgi:hypothetical protein
LDVWQVAENSVCRLLKKIQRRGARKIDPSAFAQDRLGAGVPSQYVGARRLKRNEAYESFSAPAGGFNEARGDNDGKDQKE